MTFSPHVPRPQPLLHYYSYIVQAQFVSDKRNTKLLEFNALEIKELKSSTIKQSDNNFEILNETTKMKCFAPDAF